MNDKRMEDFLETLRAVGVILTEAEQEDIAKEPLLRDVIEDEVLDNVLRDVPIFDPFPSEFNYTSSNSHCNIIVHAGSTPHSIKKARKYGFYEDYLQNIKQLVPYLDKAGELTIHAIETTTFYNEGNEGALLVPSTAIKIITRTGCRDIKKYIRIPEIREQKIDIIYSFLKNKVEEIWFAGEFAWLMDGKGCLGNLVDNFYDAGFNIKGIKGCICPPFPPPFPQKNNRALERLYENTVTIPFRELTASPPSNN